LEYQLNQLIGSAMPVDVPAYLLKEADQAYEQLLQDLERKPYFDEVKRQLPESLQPKGDAAEHNLEQKLTVVLAKPVRFKDAVCVDCATEITVRPKQEQELHYIDPVEEDMDTAERQMAVQECIAQLPARDQYILKNKMNGLCYEDIGNNINLSRQRVEVLYKKALHALQEKIEQHHYFAGSILA
jgi:RNA polymerase sigma factor (sigma-70 family)